MVLPAKRKAALALHSAAAWTLHGNLIDPPGWHRAFRRGPRRAHGYTLEYRVPLVAFCSALEAREAHLRASET